jgi:hypothetical protein
MGDPSRLSGREDSDPLSAASAAPDLKPRKEHLMKKYLRHPFLIVCARVVLGGFLTAIGFELGGDFINVIFPPKA